MFGQITACRDNSLRHPQTVGFLEPLVQEAYAAHLARQSKFAYRNRLPRKRNAHVVAGDGKRQGQVRRRIVHLQPTRDTREHVRCTNRHAAKLFQKRKDNRKALRINSGSHARNVAEGTLRLTVKGHKIVDRSYDSKTIPVRADKADAEMRAHFQKDYEAVKAFTLREVGVLNTDLWTRDAFRGMCDYLNLVHTLSIGCKPAEISFAAPLTFNGHVESGIVRYNDLFTIYPFENQLFVVKMTGEEIRNYLEHSYDKWINTIAKPDDTLLKIQAQDDPRTQQQRWSFVNRSYNFDSAAGINYTVDVTKPFGERVAIASMADGTAFDLQKEYNVAMTSYRASGGGNLMKETGIDTDNIDERVVGRYPEIRNILYDYLMKNGSIDPEVIGNPAVIGHWEFVPEKLVKPAMDRDMDRLFKR